MGLEDSTALVALIVSLIALFIASLQLLQAVFGTAEGYKRCSEAVIGPWEGLRHRQFHWRELRFEVKYITPQILIVSESAKAWLEHQHKERRSNSKEQREHVHILHRDLISKNYRHEHQEREIWKRNSSWWRRQYDPWDYYNKLRVLRLTAEGLDSEQEKGRKLDIQNADQQNVNGTVMPKHIRGYSTRTILPVANEPIVDASDENPRRQETYLTSSYLMGPGQKHEIRVSCDTLLREVCSVYTSYGPSPPPPPVSEDSIYYTVKNAVSQVDHFLRVVDRSWYRKRNFARTHASITFREWSWDMMPADMTRPLATIAVGHLVILAVRLGMQWRVLNLETAMSADGHGYSLSCTKSDRLGLVFRLVTMGVEQGTVKLIPSKAADKLMCGRLPGCPMLVKRDFDFIDNARKSRLDFSRALEPGHVLHQIGVPKETRKELQEGLSRNREFISVHNEIVPLLSAFLPLDGSDAVQHYGHCWSERRKGVLHLWEGRYVLLHHLERTVRERKVVDNEHDLMRALRYLRKLKEEYPEDFFGLKSHKAIDGKVNPLRHRETGEARRTDLVDLCREIHRWTDARFMNLRFDEEDNSGRRHYENFVAAHLNMATYATISIYDKIPESELPSCPLESTKVSKRHQKILQEVKDLDESIRPPWVLCRLLETAEQYVKQMQTGDHAVANYIQERGSSCKQAEIETAWWMLMVRGIAWNMSTVSLGWGDPIPASFYDNHVPVWIT
ncbi:hypothetical protein HII31_11083 [Pseudocercospora fuligena]|uniref:Modin n=1 Tax=Pseudocercospora fuligena TaxID=685502 RepID=A0A8H6RB78_9PEZI|nr:hypothetical protein HII31_11083 [Pseudocercospora fuligena]